MADEQRTIRRQRDSWHADCVMAVGEEHFVDRASMAGELMTHAYLNTYAKMARTIFKDKHGYGPAVYDKRAWGFARQAWHSFAMAEAIALLSASAPIPDGATLAELACGFASAFFEVSPERADFVDSWRLESADWLLVALNDLELTDAVPVNLASQRGGGRSPFDVSAKHSLN